MGTGVAFTGGKAAGNEADHSPPASADVNNGGAIPPLPRTFHGVVLIRLRTGTILPYFLSDAVISTFNN
jgi:hypothetical protein